MTNTNTNTEPTELTALCRPWHDRPRYLARVRVDADGSVRVWDDVAGHYTLCHSLSERTCRRIARRRLAP